MGVGDWERDMEENSTGAPWQLRLATLAVAGSATAYVLLGTSIVESDAPQRAACIAAGGLGLLAFAAFLGGVGLFGCWGWTATSRHMDWAWESTWGLPGGAKLSLKMEHVRTTLLMFATVGTAASLLAIVGTMFGGASVAHQVAAGKCSVPAKAGAPITLL